MSEERKSDLDPFAALWRRVSKKTGRVFYSGKLEDRDDVTLLAFGDSKANDENRRPHIKLYLAPRDDSGNKGERKEESGYGDIPF